MPEASRETLAVLLIAAGDRPFAPIASNQQTLLPVPIRQGQRLSSIHLLCNPEGNVLPRHFGKVRQAATEQGESDSDIP